ncbi:MAG TPA: SH3-like domain-containing protein [Candidatus Binataceae bacterium]|nr:SH3-like domain-containing protein [Candidatus Binataceae bacterium]
MLRPEDVEQVVKNGGSNRRPGARAAGFKPGDKVRARNLNPVGHTRLPRYVRGKVGVIQHDHGVFVFPDTHAHGLGDKPQHVYSVRFDAQELWGENDRGPGAVYIDLWDDYLESPNEGEPAVKLEPALKRKPTSKSARKPKPAAKRKPEAKRKSAAMRAKPSRKRK